MDALFSRFARGKEGKCFGGNYATGRTNEGLKDLNRDFPSWDMKGQSVEQLKAGFFEDIWIEMTQIR